MKNHYKSQLIIGNGEVGQSLFNVLATLYRWSICIQDKNKNFYDFYGKYDVIHICYPFVTYFIQITKEYIKQYNPKLVIIHSTVPIGITRKISPIAVHSPIRGTHPNLEEGIKTFVKYFGGKKAEEAAKIFSNTGIVTQCFKKPETTEVIKLWDTFQYGVMIMLEKEIYKYCKQKKVDFNFVYKDANKTYNEGYKKLGRPELIRPVLKHVKGKIGGHCIIPNAKLLSIDSWLAKLLVEKNEKY